MLCVRLNCIRTDFFSLPQSCIYPFLQKSNLLVHYKKNMKFLEVENLTTRYQTSKGQIHALDDVNFSLEKGESIGIAGESACGKSTLGLSMIRMIQGGKIVSGKINLNGESVLDLTESDFNQNYNDTAPPRSEERRVGKECRSRCRRII